MLGDSSDLTSAAGEGTAGLIPRICVELFQRFGLSSGDAGIASETPFRVNGQASIKVSFCEVREGEGTQVYRKRAPYHKKSWKAGQPYFLVCEGARADRTLSFILILVWCPSRH